MSSFDIWSPGFSFREVYESFFHQLGFLWRMRTVGIRHPTQQEQLRPGPQAASQHSFTQPQSDTRQGAQEHQFASMLNKWIHWSFSMNSYFQYVNSEA
jgi:hypothetical protein